MKARALSFELWDLAYKLKHIDPLIKMSFCYGGQKTSTDI